MEKRFVEFSGSFDKIQPKHLPHHFNGCIIRINALLNLLNRHVRADRPHKLSEEFLILLLHLGNRGRLRNASAYDGDDGPIDSQPKYERVLQFLLPWGASARDYRTRASRQYYIGARPSLCPTHGYAVTVLPVPRKAYSTRSNQG